METKTTAIAIPIQQDHGMRHLTEGDIVTLVKSNIIPADAPQATVELFGRFCKESGLSPFRRQIHLIKRGDKFTIQTGIDGYRATANRTGLYAGNDDYIFDEGLNEYQHIQTKRQHPTTATSTVYKLAGATRVPFTATARWEEYYPGEKQGFMWSKMPYLMLGKCAEALALRKAFPEELAGIYTDEEMMQADIKTIEPIQHVVNKIRDEFQIEHVDTQTGEMIEPPPPVQVEGTQLEQFDPKTEIIGFGKNKGMSWLEVPIDYIEWLVKNATKKDIKIKADATLKYRQNLEMQKVEQKSWADETFGEPEPKPDQPSEKKIQELKDSLDEASRTGDPEIIKKWASINKTLLGFLPDEQKKAMRDAYNLALTRAKNGGAK